MIQKLDHEFWDLRNMSTSFHQIWRRFDVRTRMLVLEPKRWIPWVKLKIWSKIFNSERLVWKLSWVCEITSKHDLIQNQVKNLSFEWFGWNASESEDGRSYGRHEEYEFKMRRDVLWSEMKKSLSARKWSSCWMRVLFTKHFGFGEKKFFVKLLDPLEVKNGVFSSLTQALLSLSKW